MNLTLNPEVVRFIEEKVSSGVYASPEAVIQAGIESLKQDEKYGDFAPGELDALLANGQADIDKGDVFSGEEVFAELKRLSLERRGKHG